MKKKCLKIVYLVFLVLIAFPGKSQNKESNWDIRLGAGYSLLGSGDYFTFNYETELNYKLNHYFTTSASFDLGKSIRGVSGTASFKQGNLNLFLSPFKNNKKNDFRIGTGLTYYTITDTPGSISYDVNGTWVTWYLLDTRSAFGFNIILEDSYLLSRKLLLGIKLFTQSYYHDDINTGVLVKLGYKF